MRNASVIKSAPRDGASVTLVAPAQAGRDVGAGAAIDVLERAHAEARRIREDAHVAAARALSEAHAQGVREGRVMARAELDDTLRRAHALLDGLGGAHRAALQEASDAILELATEVAMRILGQQITLRPEALSQMVAAAIDRLAGGGDVTVRVHPDDVALLTENAQRLDAAANGTVRVVPDDRVDGGCVVESSFGAVDARFSTQLRMLRTTIADAAQQDADG